MILARAIHLISGSAVVLFWALFCLSAVRERRPRAAVRSGLVSFALAAIWFGPAAIWALPSWALTMAAGVILLLAALFFLPLGTTHGLEYRPVGETVDGPDKARGEERVDERDIMFAREEYLPGTSKYETYYARRPELKASDDKIRSLPQLLEPGARLYDPVRSLYTASIFQVIEGLLGQVEGDVGPDHLSVAAGGDLTPAEMTARIKEYTLHLGAAEVGIARLEPAWIYSHVGRGPELWGAPIQNRHRFAIAFTLEMDYGHVEQAPAIGITEESAREYLQGALISLTLAGFIRQLSHPARAHIAGSNYQIMMPPVAHAAGLGELGRCGYLISRKYGARVRLGAVTTDLPLVPDTPVIFGVQDFCARCRRCAVNCPSGSIPRGGKVTVRGVAKWPLAAESCLQYWRYLGTDCGLCMKVCPYSHPPTLVHTLVRAGIRRSCFARAVAVMGEDLIYGRRERYPSLQDGTTPAGSGKNSSMRP